MVHGQRPGPRLWLSAAVHGDELNGVEIIREVMGRLDPAKLRGSVIAVPIVNVFGFIHQSRYLPDRRDLNRSFPGSPKGSMAGRLAHLFMKHIVEGCDFGIDLHTGSHHRTNLPQIRADLRDPTTRRCAEIFRSPVIMHSQTRDGSLREAATRRGIRVLLFEAGEPLRFDKDAIDLGVKGILRVMGELGIRARRVKPKLFRPIEVSESAWIRARRSGILRLQVELGQRVGKRQPVATISDAFGEDSFKVVAPAEGFVIGQNSNPLVNQGDAILHLTKRVVIPELETEPRGATESRT